MIKHTRSGYAYLQMRPGRYGDLKVVKATQKLPAVTEADCVVVRVELRIPAAAFQPLRPTAVVEVPEELVQHPVEVEAVAADA